MHWGLLAGGAACVAIPILIHLLMHRRRKPVRWGAMRFLVEAYRRQRKRLLVEKWLLLAVRCLALLLLALAIGRPVVSGLLGRSPGARTVYLVIDNSIASQAQDVSSGSSALERHKARAKDFLGALSGGGAGRSGAGESVRVGLITLAGPASANVVPPSGDLPAVGRRIDDIQFKDARADFAGAMRLVGRSRAGAGEAPGSDAPPLSARADDLSPPIVVVLSDLLQGSLDATSPGLVTDGSGGGHPGTGNGRAPDARADASSTVPPAAGSFGPELGGAMLPPGTALVVSQPAAESPTNVGVVGVEPLRRVIVTGSRALEGANAPRAEDAQQVRVDLRRTGDGVSVAAATTVRAAFMAPGGEAGKAAETTVRWSPGQERASVTLSVELSDALRRAGAGPGTAPGEGAGSEGAGARLGAGVVLRVSASTPGDALPGDDRACAPIDLREALRVGVIAPRREALRGGVDRLDAASWIRLALQASGGGGAARGDRGDAGRDTDIEVLEIEPASAESARLSTFDAIIVTRPDLLSDGAWTRLGLFGEGGGVVVVFPPSEAQVHTWPDALGRVFNIDWRLDREARTVGPLANGPEAAAGAVTGGEPDAGLSVRAGPALRAQPGEGPRATNVLRILAGEVDDLGRAVRVRRLLGVHAESGAGGSTERAARGVLGGFVLELSDGSPLLWAGSVRARGGDGASAGRSGLLLVFTSAMDLDWSDLPAKPLMVPLMQELVRQGVAEAGADRSARAGERIVAPLSSGELVRVSLADALSPPAGSAGGSAPARGVSEEHEGATETRLAIRQGLSDEPVRSAGVFRVLDDRGGARGTLVVNADVAGSRTQAQPRRLIATALLSAVPDAATGGADPESRIVWLGGGDAGTTPFGSGESGSPGQERGTTVDAPGAVAAIFGAPAQDSGWSVWLLVAVLGLALAELALARWASHASVTSKDSSITLMLRRIGVMPGAGVPSIVGSATAGVLAGENDQDVSGGRIAGGGERGEGGA